MIEAVLTSGSLERCSESYWLVNLAGVTKVAFGVLHVPAVLVQALWRWEASYLGNLKLSFLSMAQGVIQIPFGQLFIWVVSNRPPEIREVVNEVRIEVPGPERTVVREVAAEPRLTKAREQQLIDKCAEVRSLTETVGELEKRVSLRDGTIQHLEKELGHVAEVRDALEAKVLELRDSVVVLSTSEGGQEAEKLLNELRNGAFLAEFIAHTYKSVLKIAWQRNPASKEKFGALQKEQAMQRRDQYLTESGDDWRYAIADRWIKKKWGSGA